MNPITRRPGPGRGRPRKSQGGSEDPMTGAGIGDADASPSEHHDPALATTDPALSNDVDGMETTVSPLPPHTGAETDPAVAALQQVADDNADEHHPAKRQRMDGDALHQEEALDDEAVLALAAHGEAGTTDYDAE